MSGGHNDSAFGPRTGPKPVMRIDGSAFKGLGLSGFDVGDEVNFILKGEVKAKSENPLEEGVMDLVIRVDELTDNTPRSDRDENNRLKI